MKENCEHNYYIIRSFVISHPFGLLNGESQEEKANPTHLSMGRDDIYVVCGNCRSVKRLNGLN